MMQMKICPHDRLTKKNFRFIKIKRYFIPFHQPFNSRTMIVFLDFAESQGGKN